MDETELQGRITLLEAENAALHQSAEHTEKALAQCRCDLTQCEEQLTQVQAERDTAENALAAALRCAAIAFYYYCGGWKRAVQKYERSRAAG